jgi:carbonic anhydrase/acetyltransferase-like protein (isoleucine patch superfamily)
VLKFDNIVIGKYCDVQSKSVLSLGCQLDDGVQLQALSTVLPGTKLDESSVYAGTPATKVERNNSAGPPACHWPSKLLKLAVQLVVLIFTFSLSIISILFWAAIGLPVFRYGPLLYWVASFFISSATITFVGVVLKWLLLGRVKPGIQRITFSRELREWVVGYFQDLSAYTFMRLWESTSVMHMWARALGVQMSDNSLILSGETLRAAEADLLVMGEYSFLSSCSVSCTRAAPDGNVLRGKIILKDGAMVGLGARVSIAHDADSCVIEKGSAVGGLTHFCGGTLEPQQAIFGRLKIVYPTSTPRHVSCRQSYCATLFGIFLRMLLLTAHTISLVPAYELASVCFFGDAQEYAERYHDAASAAASTPIPRPIAVLLVAIMYIVYISTVTCVYIAYKRIVLGPFKPGHIVGTDLRFLQSYLNSQAWNWMGFQHFGPLGGTALLNCIYSALGASIGKNVKIWGKLYEHDMLTIGDNAVVDVNAFMLGHVGQQLGCAFAPTTLGHGAHMHQGAIVWAGDTVSANSVLHSNSKLSSGAQMPLGSEFLGVPARNINGSRTADLWKMAASGWLRAGSRRETDIATGNKPAKGACKGPAVNNSFKSSKSVPLATLASKKEKMLESHSWHRGVSIDDDFDELGDVSAPTTHTTPTTNEDPETNP